MSLTFFDTQYFLFNDIIKSKCWYISLISKIYMRVLHGNYYLCSYFCSVHIFAQKKRTIPVRKQKKY